MADYILDLVREVSTRKINGTVTHPEHPSAEYATFVKLTRLDLKLSRQELAERVGVSHVFIALLENRWLTLDELTDEHKLLLDLHLGIGFDMFMKKYADRVTDYLTAQERTTLELTEFMRGRGDDTILSG